MPPPPRVISLGKTGSRSEPSTKVPNRYVPIPYTVTETCVRCIDARGPEARHSILLLLLNLEHFVETHRAGTGRPPCKPHPTGGVFCASVLDTAPASVSTSFPVAGHAIHPGPVWSIGTQRGWSPVISTSEGTAARPYLVRQRGHRFRGLCLTHDRCVLPSQ